MNILIIGSGGREHALAWKIKQSSKVKNILVAPGNAGTSQIAENLNLTKTEEILSWLKLHHVDLVIVGPDNYLAEGIVEQINQLGIPVFGPTKAAAEIEWSKSYAKELMREEGIPTAHSQTFDDIEAAKKYARAQPLPIVIKADGLALGKGVAIAESYDEADTFLEECLQEKRFGESGSHVIIEEYLVGREISIHAFCDGETAILFPASQDHKRIFNGDEGPNTGGMGTISPVPWVSEYMLDDIKEKIILPLLRALKKRGRPFCGLLFPGIMFTADGPKVIEFNARFGDPETQSYMRLLETDLIDICFACINKELNKNEIKWSKGSACCVVLASGGYPGEYKKGFIIVGLKNAESQKDIVVFHAGTASKEGNIVTNGGRVLGVTATGENLKVALEKAYSAADKIEFEGKQFRRDIGAKVLTT